MQVRHDNKEIRTFVISPRTLDRALYWANIKNTARWAEVYGCTGVLIFTGNDTYVEPWVVAQDIILSTQRISPLVAINPVYMHPFAAAKFAASLTNLYSRKLFLNMVTGTATSYQASLDDTLDHDERYERLTEYTTIVKQLTSSERPITFQGKYYRLTHVQLQPSIERALAPEFFFAGQSEAAKETCRRCEGTSMQMLQPSWFRAAETSSGVFFGLITRRTEKEAWHAAKILFPVGNGDDLQTLDLIMKNTDSTWKRTLRTLVDEIGFSQDGFWITPFRNLQADCLYFVGSYETVADLLARLIGRGVDTIILDLPAWETEFQHAQKAFRIAQDLLNRD